MSRSPRVLLVEDDLELCAMLAAYLGEAGFEVAAVHDGKAAVRTSAREVWDLIVLDLGLPVLSGFDVLTALRRHTPCPVLILTARGDDDDRVRGLELGADDYLAKPFNPRELLARIRALLRRSYETRTPEPTLSAGELHLEPARRLARAGNQSLDLTSAELRLLEVLMRHPGRAVTRDVLCEQVLGRKLLPNDRCVDTHVSHLRAKLASSGATATIASVRGTGYQLVV